MNLLVPFYKNDLNKVMKSNPKKYWALLLLEHLKMYLKQQLSGH